MFVETDSFGLSADYRMVHHVTERFPDGSVKKTERTGKFIHKSDQENLPEIFVATSVSTELLKFDGKKKFPIFQCPCHNPSCQMEHDDN